MSSIRQELLNMPPEATGALGPDGLASPQAVVTTVVGAASTGAVDTKIDSAGARVNKQWITMQADNPFAIRFGESNIANAATTDWVVVANQQVRFLLDSRRTRFFKAIRTGGADANLKWYISG